MKALNIEVFKNPLFKGCSNGGISEKYNSLLLVCDEGNVDIDENNLPENLVIMVTRDLGFVVHKHIEPYARPEGLGWMAGGAIAHTSDSRFGFDYPLSIHDRQETQELYDTLSR